VPTHRASFIDVRDARVGTDRDDEQWWTPFDDRRDGCPIVTYASDQAAIGACT